MQYFSKLNVLWGLNQFSNFPCLIQEKKKKHFAINESWWETQFKLLHKAYILAYMDSTNPLSALCPCCNSSCPTLMHRLWNWTVTRAFRHQVLGYAHKVISTRLPASALSV